MKISLKGILEGVWNSIIIKDTVEKIAKEREDICRNHCLLNSEAQKELNNYKTFRPDFHCTVCGCDLYLKTRALSQECPLGKWKAQMSQEDEFELNKKLEDESSKA